MSPRMAQRIQAAFGESSEKLLRLQAEYDAGARREDPKMAAIGPYLPLLGRIRQERIEEWASSIKARDRLPVLLRILVHSTGAGLVRVDFPGNESSQTPGWDGVVMASEDSPWIPKGRSYWECGCNKDPGTKARKDYAKRTKGMPRDERAECMFVFVTPRRWSSKRAWVEAKQKLGHWGDVRAYDADDLEQWLEQSIRATAWFAEELGVLVEGVETLDRFWHRWSHTTEPPISAEIFADPIAENRTVFKSWLQGAADRPYLVVGNTEEEAVAFLACLARDSEVQAIPKTLGLAFSSVDALRELATSNAPLVPIIRSGEAETEAAVLFRRRHCILVGSRSQLDSAPDIALGLLSDGAFERAVRAMGWDGSTQRLARESGRSPTILRRKLSRFDAIRRPRWAKESESARRLVPIALVGAWNSKNDDDWAVLVSLSGRSKREIQQDVARLRQLHDSPVWSSGEYRGVVSKMDALFATRNWMIEDDIGRFLEQAEKVLSVPDPALSLPEDKRWAAAMYRKVRPHSDRLRAAVCETLVILSVHGGDWFLEGLGIDARAEVSGLVGTLLTPLADTRILSHADDLPSYAEAAPDRFLSILERDLSQANPVVLSLLKPVADPVLGACHRTGLLWALECLAWNPMWLPRVSSILAELSRIPIYDNFANTPTASLKSIFQSRMPQTTASVDDRARTLSMLMRRYPEVGWKLCASQLGSGRQVGFYSYRPRWRNDASGAGQPVSRAEVIEFNREALNLALERTDHDESTLGDLIEILPRMSGSEQATVWASVDRWAEEPNTDVARIHLRDTIRRFMLSPYGGGRRLAEAMKERARAACEKLVPSNLIRRNLRLFAHHWIEVYADDTANGTDDEHFDYDKNAEHLHDLRKSAMREIWMELRFDGIEQLLAEGGNPSLVGQYIASCILETGASIRFVRECLFESNMLADVADDCIQGFLGQLQPDSRRKLLSAVASEMPLDQIVHVFGLAPFRRETWRIVEQEAESIDERYWREVKAHWDHQGGDELNELVQRLLEVGRPLPAFDVAKMDWNKIETRMLLWLLRLMATATPDPRNDSGLDGHYISEALKVLDRRLGVHSADLADLEFVFIRALEQSEHGIPNLEREILQTPARFAWTVGVSSKRRDDGEDPEDLREDDPEQAERVALTAYLVFDALKQVPGTGPDGSVDFPILWDWVTKVRESCTRIGRSTIGDDRIGQLLAKDMLRGFNDSQGLEHARNQVAVPCEAVCEVMQRIASDKMAAAFIVAAINDRQFRVRVASGHQERQLAEEYRKIGRRLVFDYPFMGRVFESIAMEYEGQAAWWDSEERARKRLEG